MQKQYQTSEGSIAYWVHRCGQDAPNVVFLPGLTADHRLFDAQIAHFSGASDGKARANCLVWDPPSHGASRPFALTWSLEDVARALHGILETE